MHFRPRRLGIRQWAASLCVAAGLVSPAYANGWQGLVVGQSGIDAPRAFGDAFHAAEALRKGGLDVVQLLRDQPLATIKNALAALQRETPAVVFLAGPLTQDGGGIILTGGVLRFEDVMEGLTQAGIGTAALLVENCPASHALRLPDAPAGLNVLRAASSAPDAPCVPDRVRMSDVLRAPLTEDANLAEVLSTVWVAPGAQVIVPLLAEQAPAAPVVSLTDGPVVSLTESPVVSLLDSPVVSLAPVSAPSGAATSVVPVALQTGSQPASGEVVIFAPTPQSQQAALPRAEGLPEPSIIVGIIEDVTLASFSPAEPQGEVTSNEISYENLEARRALREQDAALFKTLVEGGAFDPPAPLLATALQTELARMGCYRAGIDGQWGGGSRRSVTSYFAEIDGVDAVSLDPTVDLFRQIVLQDDITCAAPVAAAAPRATTTQRATTTNRARTPARQAAPRRAAPAPKPRAAAPKPKRTLSGGNSLGVFR